MTLTKEKKKELVEKFGRVAADTGSPEVQIALITERILQMVEHLKKNTKDNHSRRGLIMMVSQRKRLLNYLQGEDVKRYERVLAGLGLR